MVRLFIAVNLPPKALDALARERERVEKALKSLAPSVRFSRPEGLHITMKFLGHTPEDQVEAIDEALGRAAAASAPCRLRLEGLQAFPNPRRPRVLYTGIVEGSEGLTALAARIEEEIAPLGFPTEKRSFTPHVTLGRIRDPAKAARIGAALAGLEPLPVAAFEVSSVELMRSQLHPKGSIYTRLGSHSLGSGQGPLLVPAPEQDSV